MKKKSRDEILSEMGKVLLNSISSSWCKESPKFIPNKFGSAPVQDKLIFMNEEKEKEWEELDPSIKKTCLAHLKETCSMMEHKAAIQLLCHVINEMGERIKRLEEAKVI